MQATRNEPQLPRSFSRISLRASSPLVDHVNCYVIGHAAAVVVDPSSPYRGELARLRRLLFRLRGTGGNVQAVVVTHHHPHYGRGAAEVAEEFDAPLVGHPATLARCRPRGRVRAVGEGCELGVAPTLTLRGLHTPGPAIGHLALYEPRQGILLCGDLCGDLIAGRSPSPIIGAGADLRQHLSSLERLAALQPALVLPAQGPPLVDGAAVLQQLVAQYLEREERVLAAFCGTEQDLAALTRRAFADVSPLLWPWASQLCLAHLRKLEQEGKVRRTGADRWCWQPRIG